MAIILSEKTKLKLSSLTYSHMVSIQVLTSNKNKLSNIKKKTLHTTKNPGFKLLAYKYTIYFFYKKLLMNEGTQFEYNLFLT